MALTPRMVTIGRTDPQRLARLRAHPAGGRRPAWRAVAAAAHHVLAEPDGNDFPVAG
jgi:hypothetical protein